MVGRVKIVPLGLILAISILFVPSEVQADPVVFFDVYNPADVLVNGANPLTFQHNVLNQGFNPATDTVLLAGIFLTLYDDVDLCQGETVSFTFDGQNFGSQNIFLLAFPFFGVAAQLQDGILNVTINATQGDFYFAKSDLGVLANRAAVPEPATLTLLGVGMGMAGLERKRRSLKS